MILKTAPSVLRLCVADDHDTSPDIGRRPALLESVSKERLKSANTLLQRW